MDSEYALVISMSKHLHDSCDAPYFWYIKKFDGAGHSIENGWAKTPEVGFRSAMEWMRKNMG